MPSTKEDRDKWPLCGAKKRNGETCRNFAGQGTAHLGVGTCKFHLGNATNHKKAAIKIAAQRERQALVDGALTFGEVMDIEPHEALIWALRLSSSHVEYLRQEIARGDESEDQLFRREVLYRQWNDERDRLATTAKMCLDAGVSEREIRLAERYGEAIARLVQGILGDLALNKRQQTEVPTIVAGDLGRPAPQSSGTDSALRGMTRQSNTGGVMTTTEPKQRRKSPETRLAPLRMFVLDPPLAVADEYAQRFRQARPRDAGTEDLGKRATPLARTMVEDVPMDGCWYLAAICYSQGQATALASHISRGGYDRNVRVARGEMGNKGKQDGDREHWAVLLKRTWHGRRAA